MPPELVDALLDSGRVLCHVKRGQTLVPLAQLEAFFREALLRVHRAEGTAPPDFAEEPPAEVTARPAGEPRWPEEPKWLGKPAEERDEPAEERNEPAAERDEPDAEGDEPDAGGDEPAEERNEPAVEAAEPAAPARTAVPVRPPSPPADPDLPDLRIASRYVPLRQLSGIFGDTKFLVLQLSATGLRIRHGLPLLPGEEAKLSFALMKPARSVVVRARVVWTSLARMGEEKFAISGVLGDAQAGSSRPSTRCGPSTHARRADDALSVLSGISDEEMTLVTAAIEKFANDPLEANRWYSRGRFSLSDENVRRAAPPRPRDREEVLGIWEYLDRQVDISKIAGVMSWVKGGDKNAAN